MTGSERALNPNLNLPLTLKKIKIMIKINNESIPTRESLYKQRLRNVSEMISSK